MKGIERQQEILQAAGTILTEEGIEQLTIKNLASRVGIVESALYRHFANKEAILIALLQELFEHLEAIFTEIQQDPSASPMDKIRQILTGHFEFLAHHPHFLVAVFSEGLHSYSVDIQSRIFNVMNLMKTSLIRWIEQAQLAGQARTDLSPEMIARTCMGSMRLLFLEWRMDGFKIDIQSKGVQQISQLILLITIIQQQ